MNLTSPAHVAERTENFTPFAVDWNGQPFLVTKPVIRKNRIVRTKIVPSYLAEQYDLTGWPRDLVLMREYSITLIGDRVRIKIITNADEAEDELPDRIETPVREIGTFRDAAVKWRGRPVHCFVSVRLMAKVRRSIDEAEIAPSPLPGQPHLSLQHYRIIESLLKSGILLRHDKITDTLSPDERLLVNLLIAQHPDNPPRPLSLAEIGRHLGVSDESVRRRRESLFRSHPHLKRSIAAFRATNNKGANPDVVRGTPSSSDEEESPED